MGVTHEQQKRVFWVFVENTLCVTLFQFSIAALPPQFSILKSPTGDYLLIFISHPSPFEGDGFHVDRYVGFFAIMAAQEILHLGGFVVRLAEGDVAIH